MSYIVEWLELKDALPRIAEVIGKRQEHVQVEVSLMDGGSTKHIETVCIYPEIVEAAAPECPMCGASSSLDSDMEPYCSARCRRDDGQERCEGCGKWFEMTEGRSDDDGVWLCGDCAPVLEEPAPEWKRSSEMEIETVRDEIESAIRGCSGSAFVDVVDKMRLNDDEDEHAWRWKCDPFDADRNATLAHWRALHAMERSDFVAVYINDTNTRGDGMPKHLFYLRSRPAIRTSSIGYNDCPACAERVQEKSPAPEWKSYRLRDAWILGHAKLQGLVRLMGEIGWPTGGQQVDISKDLADALLYFPCNEGGMELDRRARLRTSTIEARREGDIYQVKRPGEPWPHVLMAISAPTFEALFEPVPEITARISDEVPGRIEYSIPLEVDTTEMRKVIRQGAAAEGIGKDPEPKDIKGYAICPEWSNGVPWCAAEACPAFQGDDVPICALAGHLPSALYPVIYATVCVPEVQRWTRERSCPTPDEDEPSVDTPVDGADWDRIQTLADDKLNLFEMTNHARALVELRESIRDNHAWCESAIGDFQERLASLERNSVQVGDRLTLVTSNGYECVMTVREVER